MHKIVTPVVLAVILVFPTISAITISDAYAKLQPSGRPEISLSISFQKGTSPERFQLIYDDIGKVDRIFDTVILPVINDFLEKHGKNITNEYLDSIWIRYYGDANQIDISFRQVQDGTSEIVNIDPEPYVSLEMVDSFNIQIAVGMQFYYQGEQDNSLRYLLPNASTRVGYLSNHMQDLMTKHQNEIVKEYSRGISSFMLDDMSKTTIYLNNRQIVEYDTGIDLVLANPISSLRVPEFSTNEAIPIVKSSNYPLTVRCTSPEGDIAKMTPSLSYPNGENGVINSTLIQDPTVGYKAIEFALKAVEPEGLYKLMLADAEPEKRVYCSMNVNRGNDYPFEYVDRPQSQEVIQEEKWTAYVPENWCEYLELVTVEPFEPSIFDERTNSWITLSQWISQFGEFHKTSKFEEDNNLKGRFHTRTVWHVDGSTEIIFSTLRAFNSLPSEVKRFEPSIFIIRGHCVTTEGKQFGVETWTTYEIKQMNFSKEDKKISYVVDDQNTRQGLFDMIIPQELISGEFTLVIDGKAHSLAETSAGSNGTHSFIDYRHEGPATNIEVIGTEAIPEFPVNLMAVTAIVILGMVTALRIRGTTLIS